MVGIVKGALLFGKYGTKHSLLSSAVCIYLRAKLEGIAKEGRLDFSEEGENTGRGLVGLYFELFTLCTRAQLLTSFKTF